MSTCTITARDLARITRAIAPHCHDESAPSLNCVILEAHGDCLIATATDRYVVASLRLRPEQPPAPDFRAWVPVRAMKRAAATFRATRHHCPDLLLEVDGDRLTVATDTLGGPVSGASIVVNLGPPAEDALRVVRRIVRAAQTASPAATVAALDLEILARFVGAQEAGEPVVMWSASGGDDGFGKQKPWAVAVGDDFRAVVQPVRRDPEASLSAHAEWAWAVAP